MYRNFNELHPVYMASKASRGRAAPQLPWRVTRIRDWRDSHDMTLEGVVEALANLPDPVEATYASLGRIERGLQRPGIRLIEALAALYKTDVHSMLNRRPGDPELPRRPGEADDLLALWRRARPGQRKMIVEIAKTVVKPEE